MMSRGIILFCFHSMPINYDPNPYIASPTSQLILQPFRRFTHVIVHSTILPLFHLRHRHFTYVTAHSTTLSPHSTILTSLHLRHSSFYNPSAALPTSQLILQSFRCFTYVIGTSPTPQLILQPFCRFNYATGHSTTLPLLHPRHRHFMYFTWRAAHAQRDEKTVCGGLACYSKLLSLEVATVLDSC